MASSVLQVDRDSDTTVILTMNRPEKRNALNVELMESLCREMDSLASEPGLRIAILRGAGPVFCAGLDLYEAADGQIAEKSASLPSALPSSLSRRLSTHDEAYNSIAALAIRS